VHVITQRRLIEFWKKYPAAKSPLTSWYKATIKAQWKNFADVKRTFNSADYVDPFVIFDVGGNNFRIVAKVEYRFSKVFIAHVFSHAEYDRWNR
jgi:mRNA interferase HigB